MSSANKYYVYILQSESSQRYYVGQTQDLEERLRSHNSHIQVNKKYTSKDKGQWQLVYHEEYESRSNAVKRERQIKRMKSRKYIESLFKGVE